MNTADLPDENAKRFVAVLNKKIEPGRLMNALGHMTAGLSACALDTKEMCFLNYADKDGGEHPHISHYPFIVLKADNGNKIRKVRQEALSRKIPFADFTDTMIIGTSEEQLNATANTAEEDLNYFGIVLFADTEELKEFTGKFSLFQ